VIEVEVHSHRIATLKLNIGKKKSLLIVQIYTPHSDYGMDEIEKFYLEIETHLEQPAYQKIVIGGFNAQLGPRNQDHKHFGKFTSVTWDKNKTGELLADANKLFVINIFSQKPPNKRWIFESTNSSKSGHEIDFGLCSDRLMVTNVEFLSRLHIVSDHHSVRLTLNITIKEQRPRLMKSGRVISETILEHHIAKKSWMTSRSLSAKFDKIQQQLKTCTEVASAKKPHRSRFSKKNKPTLAKEEMHESTRQPSRIRRSK
jgi:hypothetical protein